MNELPQNINEEQAGRIRYLIAGFIRDTLTEQEHDELDKWVSASDENLLLFEDLTNEDNIDESLRLLDQLNPPKTYNKLRKKISFNRPRRNLFTITTYAIAAIFILVVGIIAVRQMNTNKSDSTINPNASSLSDIDPGSDKATLTLPDNSLLSLTDSSIGQLRAANGVEITKDAEGFLTYHLTDSSFATILKQNTLSTPKGGQYRIVLSDGSKVWLNAASALRFPEIFDAKTREVALTGEAYFEIAKDRTRPFKIKMPDASVVEVIGTHFNISAYEHESSRTTLIEGSIRLSSPASSITMRPGQQAEIHNSQIDVTNKVDTEQVIAWKNGNFDFRDASIQTIMRQVERWYDVTIKYEDSSSYHFNADISRNEPVSKLLHLLEATGKVHFKTENRTIYVLH